MNTEKYKSQHDDFLHEVRNLRAQAKQGIEDNATAICKTLIRMNAKMKIHLSSEDSLVYPR